MASSAARAAGADVPQIQEKELQPGDVSGELEDVDNEKMQLLTLEAAEESDSTKQASGESGNMKKTSSESGDMKKTSGESEDGSESVPKKVTYIKVGNNKQFKTYDKFFRKSAELKGLVMMARKFVQATEKAIEGGAVEAITSGKLFKKALGETTDISPKSRQKIAQLVTTGRMSAIPNEVEEISGKQFEGLKKTLFEDYPHLETAMTLAPVVTKRLQPSQIQKQVQELTKLGQKLGKKAPKQFAGPQAALVPRLTKELTNSLDQIKDAADQSVQLAEDMKSLAETSMGMDEKKGKSGGSASM